MSTYQAASGAGAEGMAELFDGSKEVRMCAYMCVYAHGENVNVFYVCATNA
jgi:aspartate-semialdehyde dehydrogenase